MKGVVFKGSCELELADFPDPVPGPGEVVLEMKASGMCGSDLWFYRTPLPDVLKSLGFKNMSELGIEEGAGIIAGHEPVGVIAETGPGVDTNHFKPGDRVMVFHYDGCHVCDHCRSGWSQMCDEGAIIYGATRHGGHAHYMKVPATTLIHLPDELSYATGAAVSCGTGTAYGALVRLDVSARDTVAVIGLGPVGQSAVQLAAAMGAQVIGVDISAERAQRAKAFGATEVVDASKNDAVEAIMQFTRGVGVSAAVDASGSTAGRAAAVIGAKKWGKVALVGEGGNLDVEVSRHIIRKQLSIIGSYTFSLTGQKDCAHFIADHGIDVDRIFTDRWSLEDAERAYVEFNKQSAGKGVILF
ncbi:zinc-binding dehydrogenase [Hyphomonas sp. ND6WE1B]|uniref:zinc-dependent alcohol dehydrogenase family protein n=1 Tax=Hyphomonas sp. ND6WE1B TaxID=1848191 RepID=UPI0008076B02|nr:zinc-binding dehydrogenase [Hyphomonas sp. ND6WE1B]